MPLGEPFDPVEPEWLIKAKNPDIFKTEPLDGAEREPVHCAINGCSEPAIEFFGDIDRKRGYCHKHAAQIEAMAEYAEEGP